ncbi:hypothetical protein KK137_12160 [Croceibacterium sp. LX-88]|jgi:hypothetical protein|uniref:Uncharacterized protein n=1 Tax=Croceibacterium selenioxidans TaxID=2838833 RepID=A0ABS5W5P6_9SPHN|nr:hypothetical protein [Croceibacterium selenioxidans]MBT2135083.1 hypothetical protein [Croceibacterium selenioxidans]
MATTPPDDGLPEYYLIKVNHKGDVHYVFAEIAASFNAKALGGNARLLDDLWESRRAVDRDMKTIPEAATLPEPGDYTQEWTYFSTKRQSGKKTQSG